jgi:type II secretory pathway pseudopilin PulG
VSRGVTLLEAMIVAGLIVVLVAAIAPPAYRSYAESRASSDAATRLAADLAFLVRSAQNAGDNEGATLEIESINPLSYRGYLGRPRKIDPNAKLEQLLIERSFPGVVLSGGPINTATPLLFANNGSAQYESQDAIATQHQTISFSLASASGGRTAVVQLNLFTGAVQTGP